MAGAAAAFRRRPQLTTPASAIGAYFISSGLYSALQSRRLTCVRLSVKKAWIAIRPAGAAVIVVSRTWVASFVLSRRGRKTNRVRGVEAMPAIWLAASVLRRFAAAVSP